MNIFYEANHQKVHHNNVEKAKMRRERGKNLTHISEEGNPLRNSHITVLRFDWISSQVPRMRRYAISHNGKREIPISPFSALIGAHRASHACADTQAGNMRFITRVRRQVI